MHNRVAYNRVAVLLRFRRVGEFLAAFEGITFTFLGMSWSERG
jgi:hypothetical protein